MPIGITPVTSFMLSIISFRNKTTLLMENKKFDLKLGDKTITFDREIKESIDLGDKTIVLVDVGSNILNQKCNYKVNKERNILLFDRQVNALWEIGNFLP
jgi:hypothetical protein